MISKKTVYLICIHLLLTMAGLILHLKTHNPSHSLYFWWAAPVSLFNLVVVSCLYLYPRTVAWGVLANGMTVMIGTIGMTYFSLKTMEPPITTAGIILHSTLPYILILLTKLPLAALIMGEVMSNAGMEEK